VSGRRLAPDELGLWSLVAHTVRPLPGRQAPEPTPGLAIPAISAAPPTPPARSKTSWSPQGIEPGRMRRIVKGRDPVARLDLHGLDQDRARASLLGFLRRAWLDGARACRVITGKGVSGDGVLRRRVPDWLGDPSLSGVVAGVSEAHRHHGGAGALYVALKHRPRD
jgi:DNA-nicking Smr family endonuclease